MAADIFAKIGDIKGESLDSKHKDEVEVLSWSWGVSRPAGPTSGSGASSGKASFNDFVITHHIDKASPLLLRACATGEHIKEATITVRKAGSKAQQEYLIVKMSDVLVSNVSQGGADVGTSETVSLVFAKVEYEYKPQKIDGSLDAGLFFKFDIKNSKVG
jgi:type VI secretion system secreted protein Hcp